jgi:hypothetical protein
VVGVFDIREYVVEILGGGRDFLGGGGVWGRLVGVCDKRVFGVRGVCDRGVCVIDVLVWYGMWRVCHRGAWCEGVCGRVFGVWGVCGRGVWCVGSVW